MGMKNRTPDYVKEGLERLRTLVPAHFEGTQDLKKSKDFTDRGPLQTSSPVRPLKKRDSPRMEHFHR
ncbi:hypothetical protein TNCV_4583891 [Trichonephila clavipes]|nr:hypothetical protein TNCV_4583891 [Trichonephila clavipes]